MSWGEQEDDSTLWLVLIVLTVVGFFVAMRVFKFKDYQDYTPMQSEHRIYYCPECKTVFGSYHPCCPNETSEDKCVELKETPYKTWDEYRNGQWRPWSAKGE